LGRECRHRAAVLAGGYAFADGTISGVKVLGGFEIALGVDASLPASPCA
jgi:hypothetical protein